MASLETEFRKMPDFEIFSLARGLSNRKGSLIENLMRATAGTGVAKYYRHAMMRSRQQSDLAADDDEVF